MDTTRHVLFKMPTLKRPLYKHKLLEILASPPNMIVEMGTYRRKWIPSELYDKPASSNDKLAWVICIDEHGTEEQGLEHVGCGYPIIRYALTIDENQSHHNEQRFKLEYHEIPTMEEQLYLTKDVEERS